MIRCFSLVSTIVLALSSCDRSKEAKIAVTEVLDATKTRAFMVQLPSDVTENTSARLELFNFDKAGVVDFVSIENGLQADAIVKIFVRDVEGDYRFSVVTNTTTTHGKLKFGERKLSSWRGNSLETVFQLGDHLATFSTNQKADTEELKSDELKSDELSLRLVLSPAE